MGRMKVCTYDNPATMSRECWADGKLICSYSYLLYMLPEWPVPGKFYFFGANVGPWNSGQLIGDSEALPQDEHTGEITKEGI